MMSMNVWKRATLAIVRKPVRSGIIGLLMLMVFTSLVAQVGVSTALRTMSDSIGAGMGIGFTVSAGENPITAEEARTHPNRNLITRALGPDETTLCDAFDVSFAHGDKILLCTDGLVVTATDEEICHIVCADKRAEEKLDDLIALAKAQGAPDNVTAVLIEHE